MYSNLMFVCLFVCSQMFIPVFYDLCLLLTLSSLFCSRVHIFLLYSAASTFLNHGPLCSNALSHLAKLFELLSSFWVLMFRVCDNRKHMGFGRSFGEPRRCNCQCSGFLLCTLGTIRVLEVWKAMKRCVASGVICHNFHILFPHKFVIYSHLDPLLCWGYLSFTPQAFYSWGQQCSGSASVFGIMHLI